MQIDAIDSDSDLIGEFLFFLKTRQNPNESFSETNLDQFPSNPDGQNREFHLTTFILHAFLINRHFVEMNFVADVIEKAYNYTKKEIHRVDLYDAAFAAYVATLNGNTKFAESMMKILEEKAHTNGVVKFWTSRDRKKVSAPTKILIAACAVLTYLELKEFAKAEPIIRYLLQEKDEKGYFHGIFDTNFALEALTQVERFSNVERSNILVKIRSAKTKEVAIDVNSLEKSRFIDFPIGINKYEISVENQGFVMISTHFSYKSAVEQDTEDFEIDVEVVEDGKMAKICGKFNGAERGHFMPLIEVDLERNFVYDPSSNPMSQNSDIQVRFEVFMNYRWRLNRYRWRPYV